MHYFSFLGVRRQVKFEKGIIEWVYIFQLFYNNYTIFICWFPNALSIFRSDIPDAPQSTEVHDVSSRSVRLSWSKPFDGNSPITQYTVMWRHVGGKICYVIHSYVGVINFK